MARHTQMLRNPVVVCLIGLCLIALSRSEAAEVRLKNGTVLKGNLWVMSRLADNPQGMTKKLIPKEAAPTPQNIVLVDNGWQKYYIPRRQIPDGDVDKDIIPSNPQTFAFKIQKNNQGRVIASVGSIIDVSPFDTFGIRTISLASPKGRLDVVQAISRIEPDHVVLDAVNYNWQMGMSLKAVPHETLDKLIRQKVKREDPVARFGLVRFYSQAELYQEAFQELDSICMDYPDQVARANVVREELMNIFGREVLRELGRRRNAAQHQLAYAFAQKLTTQKLGGAVMDDVKKFLRDYDDKIKSLERAKILLADWQAKLKEAEVIEQLQPLRAEINEQLNVETLSRLDAFLQAESDQQLTADQRLGLAYSGWVVGAANAITDLSLAIRYWDARFHILESLRAETPQDRDQAYQELRRVEGVGPKAILQLTSLLPPIRDAQEIQFGQPHRVQFKIPGQQESGAYSVLLPPEYTPYHNYPVLIALRSREHTYEETLKWWGGTVQEPGPALRRGYILITPEYLEERQSEYTYSTSSHVAVIESLRDARRRFSVDSNRVFLAGHGIGADAAFDLGMAHPDEFAGVIPIGGECQHYPRICYMNGRYTSWYVIGRGFNAESRDPANPMAQRDLTNNGVFDEIFKRGFQFDFMLVEYLGRGVDRYLDEVPKLFEWMDLHQRPSPPKDFQIESLRKTDNRHFWITAVDLPWTVILPAPSGSSNRVSAMDIAPRITEGNSIQIKGPAKHFLLRLTPELVDFEKRVRVTKDARQLFNGFITPEANAILDELRLTGDRTRLPLAVLELQ